ncbi:MAG: AI-2E family transporter [Candidatus Nanohaloarchaea archaeon]|nr:AI-2E family transporter [Candidatus Nanohaloarchaea archaeon]
MAVSDDDRQLYLVGGLIAAFAVLSYLLVAPFLYYLIGGIVLVYITYPLYRQVAARVGTETGAAVLTILVLLLVAVVPTIFTAQKAILQGQGALAAVGTSTTELVDTSSLEATILEMTGKDVNIEAAVQDAFIDAGRMISGELPGLLSTVFGLAVGLFVMVITMFYLFRQGPAIVDGVRAVIPLQEDREDHLVAELDRMSEAVLLGHLVTAVIQGVLAGIGLWLTGVPDVFFWTFVMVLLGIIPLVGNFLVWGPAAVYLAVLENSLVAGIALAVYGLLIVTVVDNLVRARVVGQRGRIHPLLVIVGVLGGLQMFGVLGVVLGPLVLGFFVSLLRVYRDDFVQA